MPITFNCPQGHRLTCPDELSGKPGKCPKCGVVVRVPSPTAVTAAPPNDAATDEPASTLESAADGVTQSALGLDQIIFLCPNGHRLHGAATLAGRPGQCPHCGVKFLVPSPDDEEDEPFVQQEPQGAALDEIVIQIDTSSKLGSSKSGRASSKSASSLPAAAHPLAGILAQMLRYKAQGAIIEIHLAGGTTIVPEQFLPKDAQHGVFASREADGTLTVTVVGWSSIERLVLRGLAEMPKDWF